MAGIGPAILADSPGALAPGLGNPGSGAGSNADDAQQPATVDLPADFPLADIPLVPGAVIGGYSIANQGRSSFSVTVQPDPPTTVDAAVNLLTAKGFKVGLTLDAQGTKTRGLTSTRWEVIVSWAEIDGPATITYSVITVANGEPTEQ